MFGSRDGESWSPGGVAGRISREVSMSDGDSGRGGGEFTAGGGVKGIGDIDSCSSRLSFCRDWEGVDLDPAAVFFWLDEAPGLGQDSG